jgi:hypothetical protein
VERLVLDLTGGLRGADAGLRTLRGRPFLRRLWDGLTGAGAELELAVASDLHAVQHSTVEIVRLILFESIRTKDVLDRALKNLLQLNRDLDRQGEDLGGGLRDLRVEVSQLTQQLQRLERGLDREATLRQLGLHYASRQLHPGVGPLLGGAMYLAYVARLFADEPGGLPPPERRVTLQAIEAQVGDRVGYLPEMLADDLADRTPPQLEMVEYLTEGAAGILLRTSRILAEQRRDPKALGSAALPAAEAAWRRVARTGEPQYQLWRPTYLVEHLAGELDADQR